MTVRVIRLTRIRPNYSAFKGGIIRSNPLAFERTAGKNAGHGPRLYRSRQPGTSRNCAIGCGPRSPEISRHVSARGGVLFHVCNRHQHQFKREIYFVIKDRFSATPKVRAGLAPARGTPIRLRSGAGSALPTKIVSHCADASLSRILPRWRNRRTLPFLFRIRQGFDRGAD